MAWATTQDNYGNVLGILGQRQVDTEMLEKPIAASETALQEMTENAGTALMALNDFDEVVSYFQEASHAQYTELAEEQRKKAQTLVKALGEG